MNAVRYAHMQVSQDFAIFLNTYSQSHVIIVLTELYFLSVAAGRGTMGGMRPGRHSAGGGISRVKYMEF